MSSIGTFQQARIPQLFEARPPPESILNVDKKIREEKKIITFANELKNLIKCNREHYLFLYLAFLLSPPVLECTR